jgi:hypothetical protein
MQHRSDAPHPPPISARQAQLAHAKYAKKRFQKTPLASQYCRLFSPQIKINRNVLTAKSSDIVVAINANSYPSAPIIGPTLDAPITANTNGYANEPEAISINSTQPRLQVKEIIVLSASVLVVLFLATDYAEDSLENAIGLKTLIGKNLKICFFWELIQITQENLANIAITSGIYFATLELLMNVRCIWDSMRKDSIFPIHRRAAACVFPPGMIRAANLCLSTVFFIADPKEGLGWSQAYAIVFGGFAIVSCFGTQVREAYFTMQDYFLNRNQREYKKRNDPELINKWAENLVYFIANPLVIFDAIQDILYNYIAAKGMLTLSTDFDYLLLVIAAYACLPFFCYSGEIIRDAYHELGDFIDELIEFLKMHSITRENLSNALITGLIFAGSFAGVSAIAYILTSLTFESLAIPETALPFVMPEAVQTILQYGIRFALTSKYTHASIRAAYWFGEKFKNLYEYCFPDKEEYKALPGRQEDEKTIAEGSSKENAAVVPRKENDVIVSIATSRDTLLAAQKRTAIADSKPRSSLCPQMCVIL